MSVTGYLFCQSLSPASLSDMSAYQTAQSPRQVSFPDMSDKTQDKTQDKLINIGSINCNIIE